MTGWKRWIIAGRPWGTPIHVVPLFMGTALAWVHTGQFHAGRFAATWIALYLAHSAANMISDVFDWRRGLDRVIVPTSGAIERGLLTDRQTLAGGCVAMLAALAIGAGLTARSAPGLIGVILAGGLLLLAYSLLKRIVLGDLAVFLAFGPLIGLGSWMVQTGVYSPIPLWTLTPFGLVVIAVLHANNWRDIADDRAAGVRTVASVLGDRGSLIYYTALILGPYVLMAAGMVLPRAGWMAGPPFPWTLALTLAALPQALHLLRRARDRHTPVRPDDFLALDGATAAFMVPFGLWSVVAVVLSRWWGS
ncbi:MAG: prenyltransferase [Kiritimatiellae bacterium]|nr:prenyltransferase [Kiritimatiellia bacterium]